MTTTAVPVVQPMITAAEIDATFAVMRQLRPALVQADYGAQVQRMMAGGYHLAAVVIAEVVEAVAGYRYVEGLAWGRYLYVDDLVTSDGARSGGHGKRLLEWLKDQARDRGCGELHLDSGVQRHGAHRFYLRERMDITCYHFKITLR